MKQTFLEELTELLNRHGKEKSNGTPDFVLAEYLKNCLYAYNTAITGRNLMNDRPKFAKGGEVSPFCATEKAPESATIAEITWNDHRKTYGGVVPKIDPLMTLGRLHGFLSKSDYNRFSRKNAVLLSDFSPEDRERAMWIIPEIKLGLKYVDVNCSGVINKVIKMFSDGVGVLCVFMRGGLTQRSMTYYPISEFKAQFISGKWWPAHPQTSLKDLPGMTYAEWEKKTANKL